MMEKNKKTQLIEIEFFFSRVSNNRREKWHLVFNFGLYRTTFSLMIAIDYNYVLVLSRVEKHEQRIIFCTTQFFIDNTWKAEQ